MVTDLCMLMCASGTSKLFGVAYISSFSNGQYLVLCFSSQIMSINAIFCVFQANVGQTWLADENIMTHFESLKLENDEVFFFQPVTLSAMFGKICASCTFY